MKSLSRIQIVTPGIRLPGGDAHGQRRIMQPKDALSVGADRLVIGRALTEPANDDFEAANYNEGY